MRLLRCGKGVAVKADATAAGQLCFHLIASKIRCVVPDLGDLAGARSLDVFQIERTGNRSDKNVAIFTLRAAEVKMRKAKNHTVAGVTKSGTATIEGLHVGADLYKAEGYGRADKCITAPVHADEGIDVASVVLGACGDGLL